MKQTTFVCDRCNVKTQGKGSAIYEQVPSGWTLMVFDNADSHLCPACAEDMRLAIRKLMEP